MSSFLLADIGGTNSRFALTDSGGRPEQIQIIENNTVPDLETGIARYLSKTGAQPHAAVLAIAAPVGEPDEIALTNRNWRFRRSELARRFGFSALRVVNDFEAIAWALLRLMPSETHPLGPLAAPHSGVRAVLGPGTGLGVAALVPVSGRWIAVPSEGGHTSFGPQAPDEIEVFTRLLRTHGYVHGETVLSGPGLAHLMQAFDPRTPYLTPEAVVAAALAGEPSAHAVAHLFLRLLGRFAGGLALTFKALGGIYIAGGMASRLSTLIDADEFRAAFEAHPPYETLLKTIPTLLMNRSEPGLLGCAALADDLSVAGG